ncbi:Reverse transcriptase domain-containing protein [Aix galericulata]|nr:Reverse transcriptase domain-containing protein [Aix galericulata]
MASTSLAASPATVTDVDTQTEGSGKHTAIQVLGCRVCPSLLSVSNSSSEGATYREMQPEHWTKIHITEKTFKQDRVMELSLNAKIFRNRGTWHPPEVLAALHPKRTATNPHTNRLSGVFGKISVSVENNLRSISTHFAQKSSVFEIRALQEMCASISPIDRSLPKREIVISKQKRKPLATLLVNPENPRFQKLLIMRQELDLHRCHYAGWNQAACSLQFVYISGAGDQGGQGFLSDIEANRGSRRDQAVLAREADKRGVQYTWNQLPQGWKRSPTICHGLIQTALEQGGAPEYLQYIDDIIVWSNTAEVSEKGKKII